MKILKMIAAALLLVCFAACSGGSKSYSPEKCAQLLKMTENKEALTEADYNDMIDQLVAVCEILTEKKREFGDDDAKTKEYFSTEEGKNLLSYAIGFSFYLQSHKKDLSADNLKKMVEAKDALEKLDD